MGTKSHNAGQRGGSKGKYNPGGYNQNDYDYGYSKARGERHGSINKYDNSHRHSRNRKAYDGAWKSGHRNVTKDDNCFIATACYGNLDAPEVIQLRIYRDKTLCKFFLGRLFIKFYYVVSPFFASLISKSNILKQSTRKHILGPIVKKIQEDNKSRNFPKVSK